jgi:hypothetical protein
VTTAEPSYFDSAREALYADYVEALRGGALVVQGCASCSATYFPPVLRCGACGSTTLSWVERAQGVAVTSVRFAKAGASTVLVDVDGCRLLAVAGDTHAIEPGQVVVRVDPQPDDRVPVVAPQR